MKKILVVFFVFFGLIAFAENDFSKAVRTCEKYAKDGFVMYKNQRFDISVTLDKNFRGMCIYKEKISQAAGYEVLTCNFTKEQLPYIADSMERYYQYHKNEIAKNDIFEAKMTTNGEVFKQYLANPKICQITSKKY